MKLTLMVFVKSVIIEIFVILIIGSGWAITDAEKMLLSFCFISLAVLIIFSGLSIVILAFRSMLNYS